MNIARVQERRKWDRRQRRAWSVGNRLFGTRERPRLSVHRSNRHFHCQIIDDLEGRTLAAASTVMKGIREQVKNGGDRKAAALVGEKLAEQAREKGISKVVFDRSFYKFHGRVRAFAEAAAKGGIDFLVNPHKKKQKPPKGDKAQKGGKPQKGEKAQKGGKGDKKEKQKGGKSPAAKGENQ